MKLLYHYATLEVLVKFQSFSQQDFIVINAKGYDK